MEYRIFNEGLEQLTQGAFLMSKTGNPMTIGWATVGRIWGEPVMMVLVRQSRFTHGLMQDGVFTVCFPKKGSLSKELGYCGSHSGRDCDKMADCGLTRTPAKFGGADGIKECQTIVECRTLWQQDGDFSGLDPELKQRYYGANQKGENGDPHTLYIGKILGVSQNERD